MNTYAENVNEYKPSDIVFLTMYDHNYQCLADITMPNKIKYCDKHGYNLMCKTDFVDYIQMGYQKTFLIKDAINKYPNCKWLFFSECDTLITNMDIKLEDIIKDEQKHFVITTDFNGINAGSFFIRNSEQGISYIESMIESIGSHENEQHFIVYSQTNSKWNDVISIYPQRMFNSYEYGPRYRTYIKNEQTSLDTLGKCGKWCKGDFIIHVPGDRKSVV